MRNSYGTIRQAREYQKNKKKEERRKGEEEMRTQEKITISAIEFGRAAF